MPLRTGELNDLIRLESIQGDGDGTWQRHPQAAGTLRADLRPGADGAFAVRVRHRPWLASKRDIGRGLRVLVERQDADDLVLHVLDIQEIERRIEVHLIARDELVEYERLATGAHGVKGGSA